MTDRLLTTRDVCRALSVGRTKLAEMVKTSAGFPQPIKLGSQNRWFELEVQAYLETLRSTAPRAGEEARA